jgi:hypothetical protein
MTSKDYETIVRACEQERKEFWKTLGNCDLAINPMISYSLKGFPAWPVRDSWQVIKKPATTMIFSNGLSDPYEDGAPTIGLEVVVETAKPLNDFDEVIRSWAYDLIFQVSFFVADDPALRDDIEGKSYMTLEFYDVKAPSQYISPSGTIGCLITPGGHNIPERIALTTGDALNLVVTPLLAKELELVCGEGRTEAIETLLSELPKRGYYHYCNDERECLL